MASVRRRDQRRTERRGGGSANNGRSFPSLHRRCRFWRRHCLFRRWWSGLRGTRRLCGGPGGCHLTGSNGRQPPWRRRRQGLDWAGALLKIILRGSPCTARTRLRRISGAVVSTPWIDLNDLAIAEQRQCARIDIAAKTRFGVIHRLINPAGQVSLGPSFRKILRMLVQRMTVRDFDSNLLFLLIGPARKRIARRARRTRRRVLFEGVVVDGLEISFPWARFADSGHRSRYSPRYLLIEGDQLRGALADVGRERLRLGLPRGALRDRTACRAVYDRHVFIHIESGGVGVLDRIAQPRTGRNQIRGAAAGNFGRRLQLVGDGAGGHHVGVRRGAQRLGTLAVPINRERIAPHLVGHRVTAPGHGIPVLSRLGQMLRGPDHQLRKAGNPRNRRHRYTPVTGGISVAIACAASASLAR